MANGPQGNLGRPRFGPSDQLMAMCRACSTDPTESIRARLRRLLNTFLQHYSSNGGNESNELAAKCCCEAGIWYYRILENHASEERNRLGISDISGIFWHDLLQSCLVACCLEISIFSNRLRCDFPLLPQILKLAPYHFWRVIEIVLRAEERLPRGAFAHLAQVEGRVLESLAWTSDSPLWEQIRANDGRLHTCQQVMPPTQLEDPQGTHSQPDKNLQSVLHSGVEPLGSTDQQRSPSAGNRPRRSSSLHLFARKVYSLMGRRLRELCSTLHISDELRLKIWTCFEFSLVNCTDLMMDRHLDQLLMCAIYIIAKHCVHGKDLKILEEASLMIKAEYAGFMDYMPMGTQVGITKGEIPFKDIMKCYKSQPLACKSVCKNVLISDRRDIENVLTGTSNNGDHRNSILTPDTPSTHYPEPRHGNLIYFYNQVYTTRMELFAKQFAPAPGGDTPPLSPYPRQRKASPRRRRLSSSHPIFISPYNTETPPPSTSGLCYYFNSSPSERLREINNMIRTGRSPSRGCYAIALDEEEEKEDREDSPSAKRPRLNDQSALERLLRNVVNDRVTRQDQHQASPNVKLSLDK